MVGLANDTRIRWWQWPTVLSLDAPSVVIAWQILPLPQRPIGAVTTMFFLDCFPDAQVRELVAKIAATLSPSAQWLWADFRLPERGWSRLRARATVSLLYAFFRWQTAIPARQLPPAEAIIAAAGFDTSACVDRQGGMVRTRLFIRSVKVAQSVVPSTR